MPYPKTDVRERLATKFERRGPDDCWPWTGGVGGRGYGRIFSEGRLRPATHVAWEAFHDRPWPAGALALHSCDNPRCVNPKHLRPGTSADNAKDAMERGRHRLPPFLTTHCKRGHELTRENTYVRPGGRRRCRRCELARLKAVRDAMREEAAR